MFKKILFTFLALFFAINVFAKQAYAFELNDNSSGDANLSSGQIVNDNLFSFGNNVNINGNVIGDLVAGGNQVNLTGNIGNNFIAGGNTVTIKGHISRDVFIGGSTVTIEKDTVIDGDLNVGASNVFINGEVKGLVRVGASNLVVNGKIGKGIKASINTLEINSGSTVNGDITYASSNIANISSSAIINGKIDRKQVSNIETNKFKNMVSGRLLSLLMAILTGIILLILFPKKSKKIASIIQNRFWGSMGYGFLTMIVIPFISIISLVIVIGIPISLILSALYIFAIYTSQIFVSYALIDKITKSSWAPVWSMTLGLIIFAAISMIPFLGGFIGFFVMIIGLGSIMISLFDNK